MLFNKCNYPGCDKLELIRGLCEPHYQALAYKKRIANAVKTEPAEALKHATNALKAIKLLRDSGFLDQIEFAHMQHRLLGVSNQLIGITNNDCDTLEMAEANDAFAKKLHALPATVEASSEEE